MTLSEEISKRFPGFEPGLVEFLTQEGSLRHIMPGEVLMRTGQYIKSTLLVLSGQVKVYREGKEGEEFFMYEIMAGEGCALTMICGMNRETSELKAVVSEEGDIVLLPVEQIEGLVSKYPSWFHFMVTTYRRRFEEVISALEGVAFRSLDERVEFYLRSRSQAAGSAVLHITHQEIAKDLNSSREVISRLLKRMEALGHVKLERNQVELLRY